MLTALATVDDLITWTGLPITGDDEDRASAILSAASTLVRRFAGETWVDADGALDPGDDELRYEAARTVVLTVSERVYKNPDGQKQEALGPYSQTVEAWASLGMALRDEEKEQLSPTGGVPGLATISTTRGPIETGTVICGYPDGSEPWYGDV